MRKIAIITLALALLASGCKEEETTPAKSYMDGDINIVFPKYVSQGFSKTFSIDTLKTVTRPDGGSVGYYFKAVGATKADTLITVDGQLIKDKFTVEAPQELGNHSFVIGAFAATDYYSTTQSCQFTVVKPGINGDASITNFPDTKSPITDTRDGQSYFTFTSASTQWMMQNLAWDGAGKSFQGSDVMDGVVGRFYNWQEAQSACPSGWRLPNDADIQSLLSNNGLTATPKDDIKSVAGALMGDIYFNGQKMWDFNRDVTISNKTSLSLIPVGYMQANGSSFKQEAFGTYAAFWTADTQDDKAALRYIYHATDVLYYGLVSKTDFYAPVRCVKSL